MNLSTFMIGYFLGLVLGAGAVMLWTKRYGRVSLKSLGVWWRDVAEITRKADAATFTTRRDESASKPPAE